MFNPIKALAPAETHLQTLLDNKATVMLDKVTVVNIDNI